MFLLTSNQHKVDEYRSLGIDARIGPGLPEVMGTIDQVIVYKVLGSDSQTLVDDTVLEVNDKTFVDAKYKLSEIEPGEHALWVTSIGYHDGTNVYIYRGSIKGRIVSAVAGNSFSFESMFSPEGTNLTLQELKRRGKKNEYSARRIAVNEYFSGRPVIVRKIDDIPNWVGEYQCHL